MIIPVRCMTCGKVLADKSEAYKRMVEEEEAKVRAGKSADKSADKSTGKSTDKDEDEDKDSRKRNLTVQGRVLDRLGITEGCCRTVMLTHVDMTGVI